MVEGCKFNHRCSLWIDGEKITIVGEDYLGVPVNLRLYSTELLSNPIFIDEGIVHSLGSHGSVYELKGSAPDQFTVRKLR